MKVLFKSVLVLLFGAMTTTAHAKNKPFVEWTPSLPAPTPTLVIGSLKGAANNTVPDAKATNAIIHGTAQAYIDVWQVMLYNEIMNASLDKFSFLPSKGGEQNNGIDEDGNAVAGPLLDAGVNIIWFTRPNGQLIPIAKWGDNGCLNPLGTIHRTTVTPKPEPQPNATTANPWSQQININPTPAASSGQTVMEFYSTGRLFQSDMAAIQDHAIDRTISAAERIAKINNCGGCNTASTGNTLGAQNLYISAAPAGGGGTGGGQSFPSEITIKHKANANDWVNTGLNAVNTAFYGINTFRGIKIAQSSLGYAGSGGTCRYHANCDCNIPPNGGGNRVYNNDPLLLGGNNAVVVGEQNTSTLSGVIATNYGGNVNGYNGFDLTR